MSVRFGALLVVLVVPLFLFACGDDDDDSSTTRADANAAALGEADFSTSDVTLSSHQLQEIMAEIDVHEPPSLGEASFGLQDAAPVNPLQICPEARTEIDQVTAAGESLTWRWKIEMGPCFAEAFEGS